MRNPRENLQTVVVIKTLRREDQGVILDREFEKMLSLLMKTRVKVWEYFLPTQDIGLHLNMIATLLALSLKFQSLRASPIQIFT